uniref:Uncharacterized protein n=1 Tax=Panagrolaimus sp. JU765 TaxID=591449 RepID=A0AC34RJ17_9BILA
MDDHEIVKHLNMKMPIPSGSKSIIGYTSEKKFICFLQRGNLIKSLGDVLPGNKLILSVESAYYAVEKNIAIAIFSDNPVEDLKKDDHKVCSELWFLQKLTEANVSIAKYNVFKRMISEGMIIRPARPVSVFLKTSDDLSPPLHDYDIWEARTYDPIVRECPPPKMRMAILDNRYKPGTVDVAKLVNYMAQPVAVRPLILLCKDCGPVSFNDLDGRFVLPVAQLKDRLKSG